MRLEHRFRAMCACDPVSKKLSLEPYVEEAAFLAQPSNFTIGLNVSCKESAYKAWSKGRKNKPSKHKPFLGWHHFFIINTMDHFSTLPFETRTQIYSYYFNAHDSRFCTLRIVTAEPARSEATESLTRTMSQAASKLEEHTRSSTSKIAELIRQIQVHPRDPCRRFFTVAQVNRRLRADLLSTCKFDLSGDKKMVIKLLPKRSVGWRASIALVHVLIGKGGPYSSKAHLHFAHVNSLPNLKTDFVSLFDQEGADDCEYSESMAMSLRGKFTAYLLKTRKRRGDGTTLSLEQCLETFMRNHMESGTWRELIDCDIVEAEEDQGRM